MQEASKSFEGTNVPTTNNANNITSNALKDHQKTGRDESLYIPRRFILAVLLFGVCMLMNCQRSCLSVAIVAMSSDTKFWDDGKWKDQVHIIAGTTVEELPPPLPPTPKHYPYGRKFQIDRVSTTGRE